MGLRSRHFTVVQHIDTAAGHHRPSNMNSLVLDLVISSNLHFQVTPERHADDVLRGTLPDSTSFLCMWLFVPGFAAV